MMMGLTFILGLSSVGILAATDGNAGFALLPEFAFAFIIALWRLPMRLWAHFVLFFALLIDNTTERPGHGFYKSFTYPIGYIFYEPLSKGIHLPGWKLTGLETFILLLLIIAGFRNLSSSPVDKLRTNTGLRRLPAPASLYQSCLISVAVILWLIVYGVARAGSFPHAFFQMRAMLFVPIMTIFFAYSFKSEEDAVQILWTLASVGVFRALMCIYYYFAVIRALDAESGVSGDGSYVTTHSDAILAAVVVAIFLINIYARPSLGSFVLFGSIAPIVLLGIVLNNRRIAFVSIIFSMVFSYIAASRIYRFRIKRTIIYSLPVLLVYIIVGWQSKGSWAKPVQTLRSLMVQKDSSSATRDIENFNLRETLKVHPIMGFGFGHQYVEKVKAFDISKIFEEYRYIPHNNILWFWGVAGYFCYTLYWGYFVCGIFYATRLLLFAQTELHTWIAMTTISGGISYLSQAYGDMGLMSWMGGLILSSLLGVCANLAMRIGSLAEPEELESLYAMKVASESPSPAET